MHAVGPTVFYLCNWLGSIVFNGGLPKPLATGDTTVNSSTHCGVPVGRLIPIFPLDQYWLISNKTR